MNGLIFDLDGTLVDTVYWHTLAWQQALAESGVQADSARLHRRIGMDGKLLMRESAQDAGISLTARQLDAADARHGEIFASLAPPPRPLHGAQDLLRTLHRAKIRTGIATSGKPDSAAPALRALQLPRGMVVIDGSSARKAKPAPDLFEVCRKKLRLASKDCLVVGDAIWDVLAARRAGMAAVGLLSGGFSEEELYKAGAFRVYQGPAEMQRNLHHLGIDA